MYIAICDDEKIFAQKMCQHIKLALKNYKNEYKIQTFTNGDDLIEACLKRKFDVVFLDIAMPMFNGFEVAKQLMKIRDNIILVFVSNKETLVFSSYEYKPFWFIPKSQLSLLDKAMVKIVEKFEEIEAETRLITVNIEKNKVIMLDLKKVAYIKIEGHYLRIYNLDGTRSPSYRNSLKIISDELEGYNFVRCHDKFLINCKAISSIEESFCVLLNAEMIPISRNKMNTTKISFHDYLRRTR